MDIVNVYEMLWIEVVIDINCLEKNNNEDVIII